MKAYTLLCCYKKIIYLSKFGRSNQILYTFGIYMKRWIYKSELMIVPRESVLEAIEIIVPKYPSQGQSGQSL